MRFQDLESENHNLRQTVDDYSREFKLLRNQEVTIKLLRKKIKELLEKESADAQDPELLPLLEEQKPASPESRFQPLLCPAQPPPPQTDTKVAHLQSAFDRSQSEPFDTKQKYDEDSDGKSDEMEIIVNDLERANQRAALAEQEVNHLKDQLAAAKQSLQLADQIQKAPDMEQAVDVVARSALELELANKEKEISQLVEDIKRLQAILKTLQETSASKIAQLEELVNEKDKMIVELGEKLVRQQDYEDIKKELSLMKTVDYTNSRPWESVDENKNPSDKPPDVTRDSYKTSESLPLNHIKSEDGSGLYPCDGYGPVQEAPADLAHPKEEAVSRPSSPPSKATPESCHSHEELRKPTPSPPVNLSAPDRSSPDNPSLGRLQDCVRHNVDKYASETLNTLNIARCVRELLSVHNIGQRLFAKFVLGLSQGTVSELLSKPKPWDKLTEKGRDSYRKMHAWASDEHCIAILKSLVPRRGKECAGSGLSSYKTDSEQGAEERIAQILSEAQMAMRQQQECKALPNGDHRPADDEAAGDLRSNHNSRDYSSGDKQYRRSRKYENDDIPQEMVARIYQEELAKLIGQRVEEGFRTPARDQFERTQEEIRQALTIYHQELARLSHHLAPTNHHHPLQNSFQFAPATNGGGGYGLPAARPHAKSNGGREQDGGGRPRPDAAKQAGGEAEVRHHGSAFSLVRPKAEPGQAFRQSSPPDSKAPSPAEDPASAAASPLQRMQSITNSLLSQSSLPAMPNPPSRPAKAVLPPITQQQFDQYNNVNTEDIVKKVKEQLSQYSISQRLFGESVLGLSQGSVSDLLARPKPWHMLTQKGREPFIRMKIFLEDENAVHKLVASQYKIAPEKLMRTGSFGGATPITFGSNKMSPRPIERDHLRAESRQLVPNNTLYSAPPRPADPAALTMSLAVTSAPPSALLTSRKAPSIGRGYSQPSVYEMAALTTDLDTQTITSKIKETLMAHNIGQKIFGEVVLGLSQGSVSELLSKPKPWHMLSIKGREPFIRMQMWLNDPHNVEMLQTLKNERREANKRRRTGDGSLDGPRSGSEGSVYGFAPPSPAKKPRVMFSEEQKEALRLAFSLDPYPSTATIEFLASELGLSVRTITNWFHNHRMRLKQHEDDRGLPLREGLAFDPLQYRLMLSQRLAERKGGPYLFPPYRNCSPLSSPGDEEAGTTLDLSMSSQLRAANGSSTDDRSNSETNDDSNLSQPDDLGEASDDDDDHRPRPPSSPQPSKPPQTTSSNRRKPAMPQWVDPGTLEDENSDDEEEEEETIINGVCVRQTEDFDLLLPSRVETVHVLPAAPATNGQDRKDRPFLEEADDESWDDAEAKDRRHNIEKLQQRLEKEDAPDDWEF